ncbi:MAG TPA: hypothetical protein VFC60_03915 [Tissierellaceae bacterium]|nr:hypothetical protein [Tissierellaceae bacterium]
MKIDWKAKLSSRKFWAAIVGFVTSILYAFNIAETDITQIAGIITSASVLVIYILTEGNIDSKRASSYKVSENYNVNENLD